MKKFIFPVFIIFVFVQNISAESPEKKAVAKVNPQNKTESIILGDQSLNNYQPLFQPAATILAAFIIPLLGMYVYYRQKAHELYKQRYLDQGLNFIEENIEHALNVFEHNWQQCIMILKLFRDADKEISKDIYKSGFAELDINKLATGVNYRLRTLIGDDVFYDVQQSLFAFVQIFTNFVKYDLCSMIRIYVEGSTTFTVTASAAEIYKEYLKEIDARRRRADDYYLLLGCLTDIIKEFEKLKYSKKKIDKFKMNPIVQQNIRKLKETFEEKLKTYRKVDSKMTEPILKQLREKA